MNNLTYRDLYTLVVDEIEKRIKYPNSSSYDNQISRTQVDNSVSSSLISISNASDITNAIMDLLNDVLPPRIRTGLTVEATDPLSSSVIVKAGNGTVGGKVYTLAKDTTIAIDLSSNYPVYYISLWVSGIEISYVPPKNNRLLIAKIINPNPGLSSRIKNKREDDYPDDAYIVNMKEVKLHSDAYGNLEEDSIDFLRDNITPILADNIIGNIRLSENLKILNTAGTLELNSDSLKLYDENNSLLSKFNDKGVYFYNASGIELARFTNIDARIGNILIGTNYIASNNYSAGLTGFKISDDGTVEFSDGTFRGNLSAPTGTIGGFTITSSKLYGGTIQTGETVSSGSDGVVMDSNGLRGYNSSLGEVFNLPTDGSSPTFSSGTITETIFEIDTSAVLRTSSSVGDGTSNSAGILINDTGLYGCEANQLLQNANLKALIDGTVRLSGEIFSTQGQIGSVTITTTKLSGGLIEGTNITSSLIQTSASVPRIRIDDNGLYYQVTGSVGKYGTFKYGDGTKYGAGVSVFLFNPNYPPLSILMELNSADMRLYNRSSDPGSGTHVEGDIICVNGVMKRCSSGGSPGTFEALVSSDETTGSNSDGNYVEVDINGTTYKLLYSTL